MVSGGGGGGRCLPFVLSLWASVCVIPRVLVKGEAAPFFSLVVLAAAVGGDVIAIVVRLGSIRPRPLLHIVRYIERRGIVLQWVH